MVQAFGTPILLQWCRIPFICGMTIMLFLCSSCNDFIPDQDAIILVDAMKDSTHQYVTIEYTKTFDTNASFFNCNLQLKNGETASTKNITLYQGTKIIKSEKTSKGSLEIGWVNAGNYSIQVGQTDKYPCLQIFNIQIPSGRGCDIAIKLPRN